MKRLVRLSTIHGHDFWVCPNSVTFVEDGPDLDGKTARMTVAGRSGYITVALPPVELVKRLGLMGKPKAELAEAELEAATPGKF